MAGNPREILIIKPSSLGDVVHALPCAGLLRRAFPKSTIRWLVNTEWMPLLAGNPHVDDVIDFPRGTFRGVFALSRFGSWARGLRRRIKPDLILDFQGLFRSGMIAKICRSKGTRVSGLSDAREGGHLFYDDVIDVSAYPHAVDRYLELTRRVIGEGQPSPDETLQWPLPQGTPPAGVTSEDRYIILHPFSRGEGKSLTAEQAAAFCRVLGGRRIALVGVASTVVPPLRNVIDLINITTIHELIWLLREAPFVVSVDSGPMHIAAALTSRLVSIHTWSDPAKVGPYRPDAWVWQDGRLFQQRDRLQPSAHREVANIEALAEFVLTQL